MADVNLKQFVDINIQPHIMKGITSTRDTVAVFTYDGTANTVKEYDNIDDVETAYGADSDTYAYLSVYFANGGVNAKVYEGIAYSALTADIVKSLPNELICVTCVAKDTDVENCYTALKVIAATLNADKTVYGINEKLIIARTNKSELDDEQCIVDTDIVKNFAVKYSSVLGAEMTIPAYLSQIDIGTVDSVQDYAFTEETIAEEDINDKLYMALMDANMNVDIELSNAVRNCGGNCKDGLDLVNSFVRIVLHQTLTEQLMNLLTQKIKSTTGVSKLYAVIAQELERYKTAGYLTTDKIWNDRALLVNYNNTVYTIINKGDALLNGYVIKILPMSSLTEADKKSHSTPPIYVVIADQYGIRKITINGEVI